MKKCINIVKPPQISMRLWKTNKELERLYHKKASGIINSSRATWMAKGEKCTSYFLKFMQRNHTRRNVTRFVTENGSVLLSSAEILEEEYFLPISYHKKLSEAQKQDCEALISENELYQAINPLRLTARSTWLYFRGCGGFSFKARAEDSGITWN